MSHNFSRKPVPVKLNEFVTVTSRGVTRKGRVKRFNDVWVWLEINPGAALQMYYRSAVVAGG